MLTERLIQAMNRLPGPVLAGLERGLKRLPPLRRLLEREYEKLLDELEPSLKPYRGRFPSFARLPAQGRPREEILEEMAAMQALEEARWKQGFASGAVYHGGQEHIDFLNRVYALHSQTNPLHADLWPSIVKFEAEIVAMTGEMLGAAAVREQAAPGEEVCGTVTSGGTESILLAMKAYRDWAREERGITRPEMVLPVTAHAAFDKAARYFGIKQVRIPVDRTFAADVEAARRAITRNTVVLVGSAPSFPHGVVDPIAQLSELARERGIGFHTDACLGGFVLPWAEKLGHPVPPFDFRLPGVTSISADTHKYGYAAKGTSVILYRRPELRRFQYYTTSDWPGGLYLSPTFAGSRPGGLSAACWAALVSMGEEGYLEATRLILAAAAFIRAGVAAIPELRLLGDSLFVVAFTADGLDIYRVLDAMAQRGWSLNGLHRPPAIHIAVTLRHTAPGVAQRFLADLRDAVAEVKAQPQAQGGMAPIYGMAATMPLRGLVDELLKRYLDRLYRV